jgi:hypothetical protein
MKNSTNENRIRRRMITAPTTATLTSPNNTKTPIKRKLKSPTSIGNNHPNNNNNNNINKVSLKSLQVTNFSPTSTSNVTNININEAYNAFLQNYHPITPTPSNTANTTTNTTSKIVSPNNTSRNRSRSRSHGYGPFLSPNDNTTPTTKKKRPLLTNFLESESDSSTNKKAKFLDTPIHNSINHFNVDYTLRSGENLSINNHNNIINNNHNYHNYNNKTSNNYNNHLSTPTSLPPPLSTPTSSSSTPSSKRKYIHMMDTYNSLISPNLNKEPQVGHSSSRTNHSQMSGINKFQNQYTNFINAMESTEGLLHQYNSNNNKSITSPTNKDRNSTNLLSSYIHQNQNFVKNGYSEKLASMISKKKSNFHIWLHSIQQSESLNDIFHNTIVLEVKEIFVSRTHHLMKGELMTSFDEKFSKIFYRKKGEGEGEGDEDDQEKTSTQELFVITNRNRSWPSQKNIILFENENFRKTKDKKLLSLFMMINKKKIMKKKRMNNNSNNNNNNNNKDKGKYKEEYDEENEETQREKNNNSFKDSTDTSPFFLGGQPIQKGTVLIIKEPKFVLLGSTEATTIMTTMATTTNTAPTNSISSTSITKNNKKALLIYNDLFIIYNV